MNNLLKRSIFGLVYVGIIVLSVIFVPALLPVTAVLAMLGMLHEYFANSKGKGELTAQKIILALSATSFFILGILTQRGLISAAWIWLPVVLLFCIIPVQIFSSERFKLDILAVLTLGVIWICLPFTVLPYLIGNEYVPETLMSFFILIWCSDVGAYCLGSLLGQKPGAKKLAPHISPHKSWWGIAGGMILCVAAALVMVTINWLDMPWWHATILSILVCTGAVIGDLFESLWKRYAGIKDSGNLIPGHGGLLDRLDSSLVAIPLGYIYLTLFNLI